MDLEGVGREERGNGFGGTSQHCLATTPYTLDQQSRLDGIDMAAEHVISFEGGRHCYVSFRAGTGFDRAPVAMRERRAPWA